jgi:FkbM family methyltransferase
MKRTTKCSIRFRKVFRGFAYWLLTKGPLGTITGTLLRGRAFDRLGPVATPQGAKADTISAIIYGIYEYPERLLVSRWLPSDIDCVELGCSIGVISRVILSKLKPPCRLIAVEASRDLLGLTRKNIESAGFVSRFTTIHRAVHYEEESVAFANHTDHIRGQVARSGHNNGMETPCVTLKQIIQGNNVGIFSLVMDIEGSEFDLVAKDSESLAACQAIITELHGSEDAIDDLADKLRSCGFTLAEAKHSVFAFIRQE